MSIRAKHWLIGSICLSVVVGCAGAPDRDAAVDAAPVDPPDLGLEEFDPAVLGGCYRPDPDGTGPHTDGLAVLLEEIREWYRFPSGSLPDKEPPAEMNEWGDEPQAPIDLRGAESTAADPRSAAQVRERPRERMYVADSLGADVYLGYGIGDQTDLAVAVHGPEVAFMSDCGHQAFTLPLDGYAASRGEDPATVFEAIVRGEITPREVTEWFNPGQEHPTDQAVWDDLAPEERHLESERAPVEIMDATVPIIIYFDFDRLSGRDPYLICTRSPVGRSGCYDLAAGRGDMLVNVAADVPLTLMLSTEDDDGTVDEAQIATVSTDEIAALVDGERSLRVRGLDHPALGRGAQVSVDTYGTNAAQDEIHTSQR